MGARTSVGEFQKERADMMTRINRRRFLQTAGLGLPICMLKRDRRALGSPYGMPIGLQLLTVADHLKNDLEGTLKKVAELGYREVELGVFDFYGKQPAELRRILSDQGLRAVSLHFTESQLKSDPKKHIMDAKACGTSYIGLASLDAKDRAS